MSLLDDDYVPPFKPKNPYRQIIADRGIDVDYINGQKDLEELDHPLVTEDYEDSPFADRLPTKKEE